MDRVLEIFETITKLPHCSKDTEALRDFIISFAKSNGYDVVVDSAKNILIKKGKTPLILQAHYDMVCVGKAPEIEIIRKGNFLSAKESSLGADNGAAIAMMLRLIEEQKELGFLFTNDEEIGLIGAKEIEFNLREFKYLLNLDSEEEGVIYLGCAGGTDIIASKEFQRIELNKEFFELSITNLPGGHSGIDIDKDIANAIVELSKFIKELDGEIAWIEGGERINSIPTKTKAIISTKNIPISNQVEIKRVEPKRVFKNSKEILELILSLPNGVIEKNSKFNIPQSSANLALINTKDEKITIQISLRSMSNSDLENLIKETKELFFKFGFKVVVKDRYPAWTPKETEFVKRLKTILKKDYPNISTKAIHAGLECGVLSQKYPNLEFASIGPNIYNPHSIREKLDLDSLKSVYFSLKKIIREFK